jgi:hypothetical protein
MPNGSASEMESGIITVETKVGTLLIMIADNRSAAPGQFQNSIFFRKACTAIAVRV